MLTVLGHARVQIVVEACSSEAGGRAVTPKVHEEAVSLQQALIHIPNPESEYSMRNVASRLGGQLAEQVGRIINNFVWQCFFFPRDHLQRYYYDLHHHLVPTHMEFDYSNFKLSVSCHDNIHLGKLSAISLLMVPSHLYYYSLFRHLC